MTRTSTWSVTKSTQAQCSAPRHSLAFPRSCKTWRVATAIWSTLSTVCPRIWASPAWGSGSFIPTTTPWWIAVARCRVSDWSPPKLNTYYPPCFWTMYLSPTSSRPARRGWRGGTGFSPRGSKKWASTAWRAMLDSTAGWTWGSCSKTKPSRRKWCCGVSSSTKWSSTFRRGLHSDAWSPVGLGFASPTWMNTRLKLHWKGSEHLWEYKETRRVIMPTKCLWKALIRSVRKTISALAFRQQKDMKRLCPHVLCLLTHQCLARLYFEQNNWHLKKYK